MNFPVGSPCLSLRSTNPILGSSQRRYRRAHSLVLFLPRFSPSYQLVWWTLGHKKGNQLGAVEWALGLTATHHPQTVPTYFTHAPPQSQKIHPPAMTPPTFSNNRFSHQLPLCTLCWVMWETEMKKSQVPKRELRSLTKEEPEST